MTTSERTRILVAAGGGARWIERARDHADPVTLGELQPPSVHHHQGPPGVSFESNTAMRHGTGQHGLADRRREAFARELADLLNGQAQKGEYEHLVIAAPPRLLKAIREKLSEPARRRISAEIPKDLLKVSNHDIKAWLHAPGLL
jgi:protein required for attachment to host cells